MSASSNLHSNTYLLFRWFMFKPWDRDCIFFLKFNTQIKYAYFDQILPCIPKLFNFLLALYRENNKEPVLQVQNLIPAKKNSRKDIFHVALHLFSNRSKMTSKRGENWQEVFCSADDAWHDIESTVIIIKPKKLFMTSALL